MTRDTFDMFEKPERGRFGDNESRSTSQRVTGPSDLKDFVLLLRAETAKAIGVSAEDGADAKVIWLPKSQIEYEKKEKGFVSVTVPEWLAKDKGLV